jgi:ribosomal protein S18 acetylase RimI-like enzyme
MLGADEEQAGYRVISDSVDWQKRKGIDLWDRPLPRDVYSARHRRGGNFGVFSGGDLLAVVSIVRGAPAYWTAEAGEPDAAWVCTLATAESHHGRGVGRAAVDMAVDYLKRRGEPEAWLDCKPGFLEEFYKSAGFWRVRRQSVAMARPDLPCRCLEVVLMRQDLWPGVLIRSAVEEDVPAMAAIRGREALHRDRISASDGKTLRCLVVENGAEVVGFGCLVLRQPPTWPPMPHLPEMVDLNIAPDYRGRGLGSRLIREMERITRAEGHADVGMAADPDANPRALNLYRRLGYAALSDKPVEDRWEFTDSDGTRHERREMLIFLRKTLPCRKTAGQEKGLPEERPPDDNQHC